MITIPPKMALIRPLFFLTLKSLQSLIYERKRIWNLSRVESFESEHEAGSINQFHNTLMTMTKIDIKSMGKTGGFFDCYGIFHRNAQDAIDATKSADSSDGKISVSNRD